MAEQTKTPAIVFDVLLNATKAQKGMDSVDKSLLKLSKDAAGGGKGFQKFEKDGEKSAKGLNKAMAGVAKSAGLMKKAFEFATSPLGLAAGFTGLISMAHGFNMEMLRHANSLAVMSDAYGDTGAAMSTMWDAYGKSAGTLETVKSAMTALNSQGMKPTDAAMKGLTATITNLHVASGLSMDSLAAMTAGMHTNWGVTEKASRGMVSSMVALGDVFNMTTAQIEEVMKTSIEAVNKMGAFFKDASKDAAALTKGIGASVGVMRKFGVSAQEANNFIGKMLDPEQFNETSALMRRLGITFAEQMKMMESSEGKEMFFDKMMQNLPKLSKQITALKNPMARLQFAKSLGLPLEIAQKMAKATKGEVEGLMEEYKGKAKEEDATKKKQEKMKAEAGRFDEALHFLKMKALFPLMQWVNKMLPAFMRMLDKLAAVFAKNFGDIIPALEQTFDKLILPMLDALLQGDWKQFWSVFTAQIGPTLKTLSETVWGFITAGASAALTLAAQGIITVFDSWGLPAKIVVAVGAGIAGLKIFNTLTNFFRGMKGVTPGDTLIVNEIRMLGTKMSGGVGGAGIEIGGGGKGGGWKKWALIGAGVVASVAMPSIIEGLAEKFLDKGSGKDVAVAGLGEHTVAQQRGEGVAMTAVETARDASMAAGVAKDAVWAGGKTAIGGRAIEAVEQRALSVGKNVTTKLTPAINAIEKGALKVGTKAAELAGKAGLNPAIHALEKGAIKVGTKVAANAGIKMALNALPGVGTAISAMIGGAEGYARAGEWFQKAQYDEADELRHNVLLQKQKTSLEVKGIAREKLFTKLELEELQILKEKERQSKVSAGERAIATGIGMGSGALGGALSVANDLSGNAVMNTILGNKTTAEQKVSIGLANQQLMAGQELSKEQLEMLKKLDIVLTNDKKGLKGTFGGQGETRLRESRVRSGGGIELDDIEKAQTGMALFRTMANSAAAGMDTATEKAVTAHKRLLLLQKAYDKAIEDGDEQAAAEIKIMQERAQAQSKAASDAALSGIDAITMTMARSFGSMEDPMAGLVTALSKGAEGVANMTDAQKQSMIELSNAYGGSENAIKAVMANTKGLTEAQRQNLGTLAQSQAEIAKLDLAQRLYNITQKEGWLMAQLKLPQVLSEIMLKKSEEEERLLREQRKYQQSMLGATNVIADNTATKYDVKGATTGFAAYFKGVLSSYAIPA